MQVATSIKKHCELFSVQWEYTNVEKDTMRKASSTTSEVVIGSLLLSDTLKAAERRSRLASQLGKIHASSEQWGPVRPLMHNKLLEEAGSLATSPM